MKRNTARIAIANALTSYIEDCAGVGSPEAEQIEEAWDKMKEPKLTQLEINELKVIRKSLEPTSDLFKTMSKVIKAFK